jgi:DNA-binding transcriptional MerR regulator
MSMAANRTPSKSAAAFRTISEVSDELEVPQHVLRFWETKFAQVKPMKRGGGRRYYRPEDIELLRRIRDLLYSDGYTIKGVQKLLREGQVKPPAHDEAIAEQEKAGAPPPVNGSALETETAGAATAGGSPTAAPTAAASGGGAAGGHAPAVGTAPGGTGGPASAQGQRPAAQAKTATAPQAGQAASRQAGGLDAERRKEIERALAELEAARADLRKRTGQ